MCLFSSPLAARRGGDQALQNRRHSLARVPRPVLINSNHHYDNKYSIQHTRHTSVPARHSQVVPLSVQVLLNIRSQGARTVTEIIFNFPRCSGGKKWQYFSQFPNNPQVAYEWSARGAGAGAGDKY